MVLSGSGLAGAVNYRAEETGVPRAGRSEYGWTGGDPEAGA